VVASGPQEPKPKEPLSRIEREVLEILEKSDQEKPPVTDMMRWKAQSQRRQRKQQLATGVHHARERLTPGMIFILGLALTVMAIVVRHGSPTVARTMAILALVCLIVPFLMVVRRPKSPTGVKTWRGKEMIEDRDFESPIVTIKRWWNSRH
jgi:hypothetical protein